MPTQVWWISNLLPWFVDASGAIVTRLILLHFKVSFLGREEVGLTAKLGNELPGIVNRALAAYRRMKARGYFRQPESGRSMIEQLTRSVDPVAAWLDDCAIIDATGKVKVEAPSGASKTG